LAKPELSPEQVEAMLHAPPEERYRYFLEQVAARQQAWGLSGKGGWAIAEDDNGEDLIPLWPRSEFAQAAASGLWESDKPRAIALDDLFGQWLPGMKADGRLATVFPVGEAHDLVLSASQLRGDLEAELERFV